MISACRRRHPSSQPFLRGRSCSAGGNRQGRDHELSSEKTQEGGGRKGGGEKAGGILMRICNSLMGRCREKEGIFVQEHADA